MTFLPNLVTLGPTGPSAGQEKMVSFILTTFVTIFQSSTNVGKLRTEKRECERERLSVKVREKENERERDKV